MNKKPTPQQHKKQTAEYKEEALKLAERVGVTEAAQKLGIKVSQIYSWRQPSTANEPSASGSRNWLPKTPV